MVFSPVYILNTLKQKAFTLSYTLRGIYLLGSLNLEEGRDIRFRVRV